MDTDEITTAEIMDQLVTWAEKYKADWKIKLETMQGCAWGGELRLTIHPNSDDDGAVIGDVLSVQGGDPAEVILDLFEEAQALLWKRYKQFLKTPQEQDRLQSARPYEDSYAKLDEMLEDWAEEQADTAYWGFQCRSVTCDDEIVWDGEVQMIPEDHGTATGALFHTAASSPGDVAWELMKAVKGYLSKGRVKNLSPACK